MSAFLKRFLIFALLAPMLAGCAAGYDFDPDEENAYGHYLTAIYARGIGDQREATRSYLELIEREPRNPAILEEAFSYFVFVGDTKNALNVARKLNAYDTEHVPTGMLLALEAFKAGRYVKMEDYLTRVQGFGFDNLMAPLLTAWSHASRGQAEQAFKALAPLQDTPAFEPFYAEHYTFIQDYLGMTGQAELGYLQLINRDQVTSLQPVFGYGAILEKNGRTEEARDLYRKALRDLPGNHQLEYALERLNRGRPPHHIAEDPQKALAAAFLRTAVELARDRAFLPAAVYARFAAYLDPQFDEAYLFLGNLFMGRNYPELALEAFAQVTSNSTFSTIARLREAVVLSGTGKWEQARAIGERILAREPDNEDALVTMGDLYRTREDYEAALPYYERAIAAKGELDENEWFLLFSRAICLERLGRWEEAESEFLRVLDIRPNEPDVLNYLGYSWIDRGVRMEEAREMIERAVEQQPNNGFIVDSLGWAQYKMGEYQKAVETLERAVSLEPGDPTLNDHLGDAYWKAGREREARFQWQHALSLEPAPEDAEKITAKVEYGLALAETLQGKQ